MEPDPAAPTVILSLGDAGSGVRVTASPHTVPGQTERWFDLVIEAFGSPFAGVVEQTFLEADLSAFRDRLRALTVPGEVALGGDRAAELRLSVEELVPPPGLVVEAELTPSADDPWPTLRWLIFDVEPFAAQAAAVVDELLS